jgi:hypothetical protein
MSRWIHLLNNRNKNKTPIVILIGQSNAVGWGRLQVRHRNISVRLRVPKFGTVAVL